jgi:hypothetical protein
VIRELEVLVRDREMRPRAGVRVGLYMRRSPGQPAITGTDGIACFVVPDIATATIVVDSVASQHQVRLIEGPVGRITVAQGGQEPPRGSPEWWRQYRARWQTVFVPDRRKGRR